LGTEGTADLDGRDGSTRIIRDNPPHPGKSAVSVEVEDDRAEAEEFGFPESRPDKQ